MQRPYLQNDLWARMISTLVDKGADLEPVEAAFFGASGDFRAKLTAAPETRMAQVAQPELFIEVPSDLERLSKSELDDLVRPAASGFLRSYPTKGDLLDEARRIARRQQNRPSWIPRADSGGEVVRPASGKADTQATEADRVLAVRALLEVGEAEVQLPSAWADRPELALVDGGIGAWEAALFALLGLGSSALPGSTIVLSARANEALVPPPNRWWDSEDLPPPPASEDPGVASELLATCQFLGGIAVDDTSAEVPAAVIEAMTSSGDWRFSPRWVLESQDPADGNMTLTVARAAVSAWANSDGSGLVVHVDGDAMDATEGSLSAPGPLHSYVLVAARASADAESVATVHRIIQSCPGEVWCHRGGCPDVSPFEDVALLIDAMAPRAAAVECATDGTRPFWVSAYQEQYGDLGLNDAELPLELAATSLAAGGWVELSRSVWEGGLHTVLMRRGANCLLVEYDPVTRQIAVSDGRDDLEREQQLLSDEGVVEVSDGVERVDRTDAAIARWGKDLLDAARDELGGVFKPLPGLDDSVKVTVLGLHPHGDGALCAPRAWTVASQQLDQLIAHVGLK